MADKKVFIVTSGSYSDYGINAVFSSRRSAQAYIDSALEAKRLDDDDYTIGNVYWAADAGIEEWPLNENRAAVVYQYWTAGIMLDDGSMVEPVREAKEFGIPGKSEITQYAAAIPKYSNRLVVRVKSLKSAKHAEKMLAEARQKWLRETKTGKA